MQAASNPKPFAIACLVSAVVMTACLFSNHWLSGERGSYEINAGLGLVELCGAAIDYEPSGCEAFNYRYFEPLQGEVSSVFATQGWTTIFFGGAAVFMFGLLGLLSLAGLRVQSVPMTQQLALGLCEFEGSTIRLAIDPGKLGGKAAIMSLVTLGVFRWASPEGFGLGTAFYIYAVATLAGFAAAQQIGAEDAQAAGAAQAEPRSPDRAPAMLEEREVDEPDNPLCLRCDSSTEWHEKHSRFRCLECKLWQPPVKPEG